MENINSFLDFIKLVFITTFGQLVWLLGLMFVFGLILYVFARFPRITYVKSVGRKLDIVFTGWIGTPVHELGHAVFCAIFGHKITKMRLYTPNSTDGTLGYVNHSYNPNSTYQRIGNFFIGVGPIIFGALALYAALYYLVPGKNVIFSGIESQGRVLVEGIRGEYAGAVSAVWATTKQTVSNLFNADNFRDYRFWIFLYLAICISSHMQLSPPDIKGAKKGLISIVVLFLVFNLIVLGLEATGISSYFGSWWNYLKLENYAYSINKWVGVLGALLVFASIISGLNFIASFILLNIYNLFRNKGLINPAW